MVGGMAMAMWSMIVLWLAGTGFWSPLNLIAHTLWRSAPLGATFSVGALLLGLLLHMMMSMVRGMVLAVVAAKAGVLGRSRGSLALTGMVYGLIVWIVMQYVVWRIADPAAAEAFTPWVFAVAHVMYGIVAGPLCKASETEQHPTPSRA